MLNAILVFFHVMACLTLIFVILLQIGRGHGLSGASFSQSGVQTVFGTKTADFLSKATTVMAIIFVITCISLDVLQARTSRSLFAPSGGSSMSKADMEKIKQVLEKIKAEQAAKGATQAGAAAKTSPSTAEKGNQPAVQGSPKQASNATQPARSQSQPVKQPTKVG